MNEFYYDLVSVTYTSSSLRDGLYLVIRVTLGDVCVRRRAFLSDGLWRFSTEPGNPSDKSFSMKASSKTIGVMLGWWAGRLRIYLETRKW